jgi:hypothetical protein
MKTPREILFRHHRQAEPKLDEVRRNALASLAGAPACGRFKAPHARRWFWIGLSRLEAGVPVLWRIWRELIWPARRAWAGMAVVWVAVLAVNLQLRTAVPAAPTGHTMAGGVVPAFQERQRWLAELLPAGHTPPATPARVKAGQAPPAPDSEKPEPPARNPKQSQSRTTRTPIV